MLTWVLSVAAGIAFWFSIFCIVSWVGCYFRVVPVLYMRFWFLLTTLFTYATINITSAIIHNLQLIGVDAKKTATWIAGSLPTLFSMHFLLNPHIRLHFNPEADAVIRSSGPRSLICANHVSFFDASIVWAICPTHIAAGFRTIYKASLDRMPLWGPVYTRTQAFPVHFTGKDDDGFSVNKEKQQQVQERMEKYVTEENGTIAFFPEGQLNRNPSVIQPIRFGMLKFAMEHKMKFILVSHWGADTVWPVGTKIGGSPCDIKYEAMAFEITEEEAKTLPLEEIAERMRKVMQAQVDRLSAEDHPKTN